jgi:brefeldin A-resistance guanine nucleotide exchange factor 1
MKGRDGGAAENTARIAVSCVTKTFLQYASKMRDEDEDAFAGALLAVIDAASSLQKHAKTDELIDAVPEAIKNVLLVVSASDIVARESELWGKMWARATAVDADLTPENLGLVVVSSSPEEPDAVAARVNEIEQRVTN